MPQATGLVAELSAKFAGVESELVKGDGGVFEVEVDGNLVFSKKQERRFPAYQEVPNAITMAGLA